jgi:hypothetical protein
MAATSEGRMTKRRDGRQFSYPVAANTKVPVGVLVAITVASLAANAAAVATQKVVGVSELEADNTGGVDGAVKVSVRKGTFQFFNSAVADQITLASVGDQAYVVDNQTVAKTNGGGARPTAGKIVDVDADGVWIDI